MKTKSNSKKQITKVLGIGKLDFTFTLELTENDSFLLNRSIESIDSLEGLKVLSDKPELWDKISIASNSQIINSFLYINKVSKHKIFVEFAALSPISLSEEEMFLKPILTYATEHNFLFINEHDILPFYKTSITFIVKKGSEVIVTLNLCQNENSNVNRTQNTDEATMFERLVCDYSQFNFLFIDLNEFIDLAHFNIGFSDVLNLLSTIDRSFKNLSFILFFPYIMTNMNLLNMDALTQLTEILSYSDNVIFEKKEAVAFFNLLQQINFPSLSLDKTASSHFKGKSMFKLTEKAFIALDYRRKKHNYKGGNRIGLFLDDLNSLTIVESNRETKEKSTTIEQKISIIPKLNQANKRLVEEYKKQIELHKPFLTSVFIGGFLNKFLTINNYEIPFTVASEITKRCLDLYKLGLDFPISNDFYIVEINKNLLMKLYEKKQKQEKGFLLDCINLNNSRLNEYNPLFDNNLSSFFSSQVVRKHLNEQGFINTRGFLLMDTNKKNTLLVDKSAEKFIKRDKSIMLAVKENSEKINYETVERLLKQKSKILSDPSINQLEKLAMTLNFSPNKNRQLPTYIESGFYLKSFGKNKLKPLGKSSYNLSKTANNGSFKKSNKPLVDYESIQLN